MMWVEWSICLIFPLWTVAEAQCISTAAGVPPLHYMLHYSIPYIVYLIRGSSNHFLCPLFLFVKVNVRVDFSSSAIKGACDSVGLLVCGIWPHTSWGAVLHLWTYMTAWGVYKYSWWVKTSRIKPPHQLHQLQQVVVLLLTLRSCFEGLWSDCKFLYQIVSNQS